MNWYLETLYKIIVRPILFFTDMPRGTWQEDALSFAMVTGWILSFAITVVLFINSYMPTGLSLIEGIYGRKLVIILPVLAIMGFAFFAMTLLIIGGLLILAVIGLFVVCAAVLNFLLVLLGGSGNIFEVVKATLYCSAAILAGLLNIFLLIAVKYKVMSAANWIIGENVIFLAASVFLYGLFAILGRKTHNVPRWKAFLAATVPFIMLLVINVILSMKVLPKVMSIFG